MADVDSLKDRVGEEVRKRAQLLVDVSHRIHSNPEIRFLEHASAETLTSVLEDEGLVVERGIAGLETAFAAYAGSEGPCTALLCEYDALPGIGHGCGHNVIAAAGLGAGLAAAAVAEEAGGRVVILGTPAEEGGGGKVLMIERGVLEGVDAALMVHPASVDLTEPMAIAIATLEVDYRGEAAHAAANPEQGRNALDAAVLGYTAVAALRQHIGPNERIHGIFTRAGDQPNIVPDHAVAHWYVRSGTSESLQLLKPRVIACLEAGAAATGCRMEVRPLCPDYAELRTNRPLLELYRANSARVGRPVPEPTPERRVLASTDAGNVSQTVPTVHPMVKIAPDGVALHSSEFARWAGSPEADRAVLEAATALAMTAVDIWARPDALEEVRAAFAGGP